MKPSSCGQSVLAAVLAVAASSLVKADSNQWTIQGSYAITPTTPLRVGNQRQLLMDNYVVEDRRACRRTVHAPRKHPANPLLSTGPRGLCPDRSFNYASVDHDRKEGLYRVWISSSVQIKQPTPPGFYWLTRGRYYESIDGIQWRAPVLNLVDVDGTKANNVFVGGTEMTYDSVGISRTPHQWQQRGRYMMVCHEGPAGRDPHPELVAGGQELRLSFSDDGVHWREQKENPIFRGQSDTANNVCYNPERQVMMYYRRPPINAGEIRRIAYSESADLIHWSQPEHVLIPDELDPYSFYCMPVVKYQGVYIGFLHMFYLRPPLVRSGNNEKYMNEKYMKIDVELAWSRDGKQWERHPERPLFLETGPAGSYDQGMVYAAKGLIEQEDQLGIYYTGHENLHISTMPGESHLCLANLRRDGFVSLDAPEDGSMLTKPIECPGGNLHINARTREGGTVSVSIRRGDGQFDGARLPGWKHQQCHAFLGDAIDHTLRWKGQTGMQDLQGQAIRLEFNLQQAELFSFWFE